MRLAILHAGREVGHLSFDAGNQPVLDSTDAGLQTLLEQGEAKGVPVFNDVYVGGMRVKIETFIRSGEPLFPFALQQWLERQGYEVFNLHPETDDEIIRSLEHLTDSSLKDKIRAWLPTASYLEKTYLIAKLRGDKSVA